MQLLVFRRAFKLMLVRECGECVLRYLRMCRKDVGGAGRLPLRPGDWGFCVSTGGVASRTNHLRSNVLTLSCLAAGQIPVEPFYLPYLLMNECCGEFIAVLVCLGLVDTYQSRMVGDVRSMYGSLRLYLQVRKVP